MDNSPKLCIACLEYGIHVTSFIAYLPNCRTTPLPKAWTERLTPVLIKQFTSTTGPKVNIPESPQEVFELFFSDDLLDIIVEESNRYAAQVMGDECFRE